MENWFEGGYEGTPDFIRAFQRRHRMQRGDITPIILQLLAEKPMHGYEIIRKLEEKSHGFWRPSAGSVYPTLQLLEERELVTSHEEGGKKIYTLTDAGRKEAEQPEQPDMRRPWERDKKWIARFKNMRGTIHDLMKVMKHLALEGSDDQLAQAKTILDTTHKQLEELLKTAK